MLKYKTGCLISAFIDNEVNVLGHQANCMKVMNAGNALEVRKRLPELYAADQMTIRGSLTKLGTFTYHTYGRGTAFNLYLQYDIDRRAVQTDYVAIRNALRSLAWKLLSKRATARIGLPKLQGCDWEVVSAIIEEELGSFDVSIYSK